MMKKLILSVMKIKPKETDEERLERLRIQEETRKRILIQDLSNFELRLANGAMHNKYFSAKGDYSSDLLYI